jgi:SAM-dependent methyltransferase
MFHVKPDRMEVVEKCPVCGNVNLEKALTGKDFFLTGEDFTITGCPVCTFWMTSPRPGKNEIGSYYQSEEYISHNTGKQNLLTRVYTLSRSIRVKGKYTLVRENSPGTELLDIGCGTGEFIYHMGKKGFRVTGIEPSEQARNFATGQFNLNVKGEEYLGTIAPSSFDAVTMWHVLEHVHDLEERMATVERILRPGGIFVVAVPNRGSWDAMHYGPHWAAYDLPRHLYHFSPQNLQRLLNRFGFETGKILPMKLDAFYISLLSEKYRSGSRSWFRAAVNGLRSNNYARRNGNNYSSIILIGKKAK